MSHESHTRQPNGAPSTWNRSFFLLIQGQFVSNVGNQIYDIVLLLWLKDLSGSATLMGIAMLVTNASEVLLAPMGGVLADRYKRARMMVGADVAGAVLIGMLVWVIASPVILHVKIAMLMVTNLLLGCANACFQPAVAALIPALIQEKDLAKANAAHRFSGDGARLIGQALGGVLYTTIGVVLAYVVNAVSFLLSAVSELFIKEPTFGEIESVPRPTGSLFREVKSAASYTWRITKIRRLIKHISIFHFFVAALPIVLPFLVEDVFGLPPIWFGFYLGAFTGGVMAGFVLAGFISSRIQHRQWIVAVAAFLSGLFFLLAGRILQPYLALFPFVGIGISIGVIVVNLMTELQIQTKEGERGRVLGIAQAVAGVSWPIGMGLTGIIIDLLQNWFSLTFTLTLVLTTCGLAAFLVGFSLFRSCSADGAAGTQQV